jgi:polyhydroxyalkanoate synthesis regulator protein
MRKPDLIEKAIDSFHHLEEEFRDQYNKAITKCHIGKALLALADMKQRDNTAIIRKAEATFSDALHIYEKIGASADAENTHVMLGKVASILALRERDANPVITYEWGNPVVTYKWGE